ncbi:MAG: electron transfer flavoprotein subunit alpha/FixB family protein [Actinomycetaceae bacterium]|nr:electron transfer flavoprotein subunit alpha/FixB family protein [Actinomycetaceae bacterium]
MSNEKLDTSILVMTDHTGNDLDGYVLTDHSKQLLTLARSLTTGTVIALALNPAPEDIPLSHYGADIIAIPRLQGNSPRVSAVVADAVNACVNHYHPAVVLCVSNARGREVSAGVATLQSAGVAVDVTELTIDGGQLIAGKAVLSGTWETRFHVTKGSPIIAVKTAGMPMIQAESPGDAVHEIIDVEFRQAATAIKVISSKRDCAIAQSLTDAAIVVCGGAATQGDFTLVNALAERLGAAVGATRVCTDQGWIDRSTQVGLSGVSISPQLYIGAGISGDIHHVSGIRGAETIVAINTDPDAPIFDLVDLGIIGDMNTVIPQVLDELGGSE